MEIVSLLGAILDRMAFEQDVDWDYDCDVYSITIKATSEIKDYAESLIDECTDSININRNEYDYITMTLKNNRINKVCYGNEEHDVRDTVDRYVNDWDLEDIYSAMCRKIMNLLYTQN